MVRTNQVFSNQKFHVMHAYFSMIIDINECREERDVCHQECVNTDGSYHCDCRSGYRLTVDEISCNGIEIVTSTIHFFIFKNQILNFRH